MVRQNQTFFPDDGERPRNVGLFGPHRTMPLSDYITQARASLPSPLMEILQRLTIRFLFFFLSPPLSFVTCA